MGVVLLWVSNNYNYTLHASQKGLCRLRVFLNIVTYVLEEYDWLPWQRVTFALNDEIKLDLMNM